VTHLAELQFRSAAASDAEAIANLHADSWRRTYRGTFSDSFLDGDVVADRLATWAERLRERHPRYCTIVAQDQGRLVGFAHTVFDEDPMWGTLLDNLHIAEAHKRRGIGSRLLASTAAAVLKRSRSTGLHLWVLEENVPARAFYDARGGRCIGRAPVPPPGGIASRLIGSPAELRYAWPEPTVLLERP
jgi:GNAT superfamily N-acetyltransferase